MCIKVLQLLETTIILSPRTNEGIGSIVDKLTMILSLCHIYLNKCSSGMALAEAASSFLWTVVRANAPMERDRVVLAIRSHWKCFTGLSCIFILLYNHYAGFNLVGWREGKLLPKLKGIRKGHDIIYRIGFY